MKTKTLSEICQLVKTEYVEEAYWGINPYIGMCLVVKELNRKGKLSLEDCERFMTEYRKFTKNRRVFYDYYGNKVKNSSYFAWNPKNRSARHKWLDQRILINDK